MNQARTGARAGWRKSSYSSDTANCVEILQVPAGIWVRDSKNPDDGVLAYADEAWRDFLSAVRHGEFGPH